MQIDRLKEMIEESENVVALTGSPLLEECGYPYVRYADAIYDIESKYGYSPDELFSLSMYNYRPELFFRYYREEVLHEKLAPSATFYALAEMERRGKVKMIVTRSIHGLCTIAGCRNVIELRGSVLRNTCPHCGREYPMEYILKSTKVPVCQDCFTTVRPGIVLAGEMLDNRLVTQAADAISQADMVLVLGTNLKSDLTEQLIKYYRRKKLVLIKKEEHYMDRYADYCINDYPKNILPLLV